MYVFFTFTENSQLRGHNLKLKKLRAIKSIKLNSFSMRNIPVWNSLHCKLQNSISYGKTEGLICRTSIKDFYQVTGNDNKRNQE